MKKSLILIFGIVFLFSNCQDDNEIGPAPAPQFDISKNDQGFYAGSGFVVIDDSENVETIAWDFGDGTVGTDTIMEHSYDKEGAYEITLTACNSGGCETTSMRVTVKDSIINLLAGETSKTWTLIRWTDADGQNVNFDACLSCIYSQTFYNKQSISGFDGEHKWLNSGLLTCGDESVQCNTYGPEGHGWFYFALDPYHSDNAILIGERSQAGYVINVNENQLYLESGRNEFYYEAQ